MENKSGAKYVAEQLYLSATYFLALAGSDMGSLIREKYPDLLEEAQRISREYEGEYMEQRLKTLPEAKEYIESIAEVKMVLPLIDQNDIHSIKELNELLKHSAESLQALLLFNQNAFYDKYFFSLISHSTGVLTENPMKDERFALWFAGSKVADSAGKPIVVYHGTGGLTREFDEFKFNLFPAVYFAENKSYSEWFAREKNRGKTTKEIVHQCYLRIANPLDLTTFGVEKISYKELLLYIEHFYGVKLTESKAMEAMSARLGETWTWRWFRMGEDILKELKKQKEFDGISFYENNPDDQVNGKENITKAWLVFNGTQIKSADVRNTTYSLSSQKITMETGGAL